MIKIILKSWIWSHSKIGQMSRPWSEVSFFKRQYVTPPLGKQNVNVWRPVESWGLWMSDGQSLWSLLFSSHIQLPGCGQAQANSPGPSGPAEDRLSFPHARSFRGQTRWGLKPQACLCPKNPSTPSRLSFKSNRSEIQGSTFESLGRRSERRHPDSITL